MLPRATIAFSDNSYEVGRRTSVQIEGFRLVLSYTFRGAFFGPEYLNISTLSHPTRLFHRCGNLNFFFFFAPANLPSSTFSFLLPGSTSLFFSSRPILFF